MGKYLIVDDNQSITKMLSEILSIEGHESVVSNDGRNALTLIENHKFDAILLDIAMPEFSGLDVIDKLESTGKLKENRVLVLTASGLTDKQEDELKARGVTSVLKKPVNVELLLDILK